MKGLLLLIAILIMLSCSNSSNQKTIEPFSIKSSTVLSNDSIIEQTMLLYLDKYLKAFINGQADTVISLIYPGMFEYMKIEFPNDYSPELIEEMLRKPIDQLQLLHNEKKIIFEFEIGDITKKVSYGDDKLYRIIYKINGKKELDTISMGDELVAISQDKGQKWTFIQFDKETTPQILKLRYPENIIRRLIN